MSGDVEYILLQQKMPDSKAPGEQVDLRLWIKRQEGVDTAVATLVAMRCPHPTLSCQGCPWRNGQYAGGKSGPGGRGIIFVDVKDGWRKSGRCCFAQPCSQYWKPLPQVNGKRPEAKLCTL